MKKLFIQVSNTHETVFKFFLVVASIIIIVVAMPREIQFNYEVQEGKPWAYESLEAPFDYAIVKSESELNAEQSERLKSVNPIFSIDSTLKEKKIAAFIDAADKELNDKEKFSVKQKQRIIDLGTDLLNKIYDHGIIFINDRFEHAPLSMPITLLSNHVAEEKEVGDFYSLQSAYDLVFSQVNSWLPSLNAAVEPATLVSLLQNSLIHNVLYNEAETRKWTDEAIASVSRYRGKVQKGETVIRKGEVVDKERLQRIESLKQEITNRDVNGLNKQLIMLGHFILVSLVILMLVIFLRLFRKDYYDDNKRVLFLMLNIIIMTLLFLWVRKSGTVDLYLVPLCVLPIVIRTFFDVRTALFAHTSVLLILGFVTPNGFEFMFIQSIAGMAAIFSSSNMRNRSQFFSTAIIIFIAYSVSFIGISVLHEGSWKEIEWINIRWFIANVIITLFAFPLIFVFEKIFGFTSDISLMEIGDFNSKLLRELAFKAPGTFQHSMQVANLAEAAIFEIGGNTLLARAGALYHDIGKIDMPNYFIENQNSAFNPHDDLPFEESARIIKSHVIKGIEKAKKHRLPEPVIDFIRTHHGTMRLQYFYQSFLKTFPNDTIIEEQFRYQGVLPFSKETAVVMMADGVEATSKSLKAPDSEAIDALVESIINGQMEQNQFINCNITFKDVSTVKKVFKKMLMSIYHVRIEYPK